MSESMRSWLWAFASSQAHEAYQGGYDLRDMPFVPGNRVQVLRFLTFPAPGESAGIWALVGDRTHCIAVLFDSKAVEVFQRRHEMRLTSLKGALVTLSQIRLTVGCVHTRNDGDQDRGQGLVYRHLQPSMLLDVASFQVVSSINEPIWFTKIHAITSKKDLDEEGVAQSDVMVQWMKQWIRNKALAHTAAQEHARLSAIDHAASTSSIADDSTRLPTPGQRVRTSHKRTQPDDTVSPSKKPRAEDAPASTSILQRVYNALISSTPPSQPTPATSTATTASVVPEPIAAKQVPTVVAEPKEPPTVVAEPRAAKPTTAEPAAKEAPTVIELSPAQPPPSEPTVIVLSPVLAPAQAQAPEPIPAPVPIKKKKTKLTASQKQAKKDKALADL